MPRKKKKERKRGRPRLLRPDRKETLIYGIQIGMHKSHACGQAKVSYQSFNRWFNAGREEYERTREARDIAIDLYIQGKAIPKKIIKAMRPDPDKKIYFYLYRDIAEAEAIAIAGWAGVIDNTAQMDASWSRHQLVTRYPDEYAPKSARQEVAVTARSEVTHSGTLEIEEKKPDVDRITEILTVLSESGALIAGQIAALNGADDTQADKLHPDDTNR